MAAVSCLRGRNPDKGKAGHDAHQFPAVLSEVQAGNCGGYPTTEYGNYQGAGRTGAEPKTQSR